MLVVIINALSTLFRCFTIISAGHFAVVRHMFNQQTRRLGQGFNFVRPWEQWVVFKLPTAATVNDYRELRTGLPLRYDPEPYEVNTKDQIVVEVDLWIDYTVENLDALTMLPTADYKSWLDDRVREKTLEIVGETPRKQLNVRSLAAKFAAVEWPAGNALKITRVGVQAVDFDERMQEILRAESIGLRPHEAVAHVERMGLNNAVREGRIVTPSYVTTVPPVTLDTNPRRRGRSPPNLRSSSQ